MKNLLRNGIFCLLTVALIITSSAAFSQKIVLNPEENGTVVKDNTYQHLVIEHTFSFFDVEEVKTPEGLFSRIIVPGFSRGGEYGEPEFPVNSQLIEVPAGAVASVRILSSITKEYSLQELGMALPLYPFQPPVSKSDENVRLRVDKQVYRSDAYAGADPIKVELLGVMRGVNIARLDISPIDYNPLQHTIRVYEKMEIEVVFSGGDAVMTEEMKRTYSSPLFSAAYRSLINYTKASSPQRDTITRYPVKYVIVSDPMFEAQLQPFVDWKTRMGFEVIEAYTDDPGVGTTTYQIKTYLQSLYDNATPDDPAPTYVLFVGDIAQVPTWTGQAAGHVTDLYYVEYTGDYFPEMYYGRFSAQNTTQLQAQIDKTLMYEQFTMDDPSYLEEVVMIAGMDGSFGPTHGNGQINYGTINYFNEDHDIFSHTYLYPESGSNAANIRQDISDGVGLANYTAHGSPSGWADPSFTTSHIPAMQNQGKYALLVGNCCSTSEYQVNECFGEALLRAENKGAMGYIGASNSTYWDEDYYFGVGVGTIAGNPPSYEETTLGYYDRAFHDHGEPFADWYTTMGQMIYSGNLAVTLGSPSMARYYWEAYCLMGDPSVMVYLGMPSAMTVTYDPLIPLGSPSFAVNAVPYAYVALSIDGTLLGAALADSTGLATLSLQGAVVPGMAEVVATAQNYQPYFGSVLIANPEGPYVLLNDMITDDSAGGNNNGLADAGESLLLDTELKNWGSSDAMNTVATLVLLDSTWVTVTDDFQEFGLIAAGDSVMQTGAYALQVLDSVPDMATVAFDLVITDTVRETWNSSFSIQLHAPVMHIGTLSIVDTATGNGNGRLDPGETADIFLQAGNTGHCDAMDAMTVLSSNSPGLTLNIDTCHMDTLAWGNMYPMHFSVTVSEEMLPGETIHFSFHLSSMPYTAQKEFLLPVGLIIEDFETGDFSSFGWLFAGNQPWTITSSEKQQGEYSAASGDINDLQTSVLYIDMEVIGDDSISFFRKVSCEDDPSGTDYDWLAFYIDDIELDRWDGELDWSQVSYPVQEGSRTFKWVYNKDYSVSSGSDAAWVDYIVFPGVTQAVGVGELAETKGLSMVVFPNPSAGQASLYIKLATPSSLTVRIIDITGRQVMVPVKQRTLPAGDHSLAMDINMLPAGVYFVVLESERGTVTKKLIRK